MLYAKNVANGMYNGCVFFIRLRVKKEFIVNIAPMN